MAQHRKSQPEEDTPLKLVIGCGYLGTRVAAAWRDAGHTVAVVTRSPDRAQSFAAQGFTPIVADVLDPPTLKMLPRAETVLYAVGYDPAAGHSRHRVYVGGLANVLEALSDDAPAPPDKIIYISTTGVYGAIDGDITEKSPCDPTREGGRACLEAECMLAAHPFGSRRVVLRLAGIYGPDRVPNRQALLDGDPIVAAPDSRLNLIHVDDACRVVLAADAQAEPPALYLVSDGNPPLRSEFYAEAARLLGAPAPKLQWPPAKAEPQTTTGRTRGDSAKIIRNDKLLQELKVQLAYPDFRAGLRHAILGQTD